MKKREIIDVLDHFVFRAKFLVFGVLCSLPLVSAASFIAPGVCILAWIVVVKTKKSWWAEEIRYFVMGFVPIFIAVYLTFVAHWLRLPG